VGNRNVVSEQHFSGIVIAFYDRIALFSVNFEGMRSMKFLKSKLVSASALLLSSFGGTAASAGTVLTFPTTACTPGPCGNFSYFSQSYGDQAGLNISYRSLVGAGNSAVLDGTGIRYWNSAYGDLSDVAWGGTSDGFGVPEITFLLTAPGSITLEGLDFAGYPFANRLTDFRIYDLNYNSLFSSGPLTTPGGGHSAITFNTTSTSGLILQWGPNGYNVGIDNLAFRLGAPGAVPEPATWAMMLLGFGLVGGAMRRRKSAAQLALA
jgi:PEP-CTERM motif